MIKLVTGAPLVGWPRPPKVPRKPREALSDRDYRAIVKWLVAHEWTPTADLAVILAGTGCRIHVEVLRPGGITGYITGDAYDLLKVTGKGGHMREVPVVDTDARFLLRKWERLERVRAVSYQVHLKRWNEAISALGIKSPLATPHSLRHRYATQALAMSGNNLPLVQELLGHASVGTTARYVTVSRDDKARALGAHNPNPATTTTTTEPLSP